MKLGFASMIWFARDIEGCRNFDVLRSEVPLVCEDVLSSLTSALRQALNLRHSVLIDPSSTNIDLNRRMALRHGGRQGA